MSGNDCNALTCVKSGGIVGNNEFGITVDWNVTLGETYSVYIRGTNSTGNFWVSIEPLRVPTCNDVCGGAGVISLEDGIISEIPRMPWKIM
jgi:hypothetical protein